MWTDVVQVSGGAQHTIGLRSTGRVIAVGDNFRGQRDVADWRNIVRVDAGTIHTIGLKSNGEVVAAGYNGFGQCNVDGWRDIAQISAGYGHTVGLKSSGRVIAVGLNTGGQCNVGAWDLWTLIFGHVWDRNNHPVVGATIIIDSPVLGAPIELITDSSGYYKEDPVLSGTYTVTGTHPSYSFMTQEVEFDGINDVDVSFYTITGYVKKYGRTDPDAGINGVNVRIAGGDTYIDETIQTVDDGTGNPGYYEKQGVGNGTYTIEAQNP